MGKKPGGLLKLLPNVTAPFSISIHYSNILRGRGIGEELRIKINGETQKSKHLQVFFKDHLKV